MPTADRKLRVFLCHSSQDKPIVRELYQRLLAEGWIDPWLDEEKIIPGQDWDMEIVKSLRDSHAILVCLSKNSVTKEGYFQKEIKYAIDKSDEMPEDTIFIIPVRLEDCKMPTKLARLQYVDYFPLRARESSHAKLAKSLSVRAKDIGLEYVSDQPVKELVRLSMVQVQFHDNEDEEAIELKNLTFRDIDLTSWELSNELGDTFKFPVFILRSNQSVMIYTKEGVSRIGAIYWGSKRTIWNRAKELYVRNGHGRLIDKYKIPERYSQ